MFNNQIIRRITATLLAAFLVDAWTFEAALAARGSPVALSRSEGSEPALVTDTGLRQLAGRLMTAQPSSPKRIPQTEPQRSAPAPKPDIGAVDRYSRTLQSISAAIAAEEARGAIGRSSEAGAIGPNMHIMVKEPWTEDKATAVRTVLAHAKQAAPLEAAVERNFVAFDAHVQRHKLPSVIRERQHLAQTECIGWRRLRQDRAQHRSAISCGAGRCIRFTQSRAGHHQQPGHGRYGRPALSVSACGERRGRRCHRLCADQCSRWCERRRTRIIE